MQIVRRSDLMVTLSLAVFLGVAAAIILNRTLGMPWLGLVVGGLGFLYGMRRPFGRWRATRQRLPSEALHWLGEHVPFYRALGRRPQARFERDVQIALAELRFEGVADAKATDELKLAVAAGAALLLHGRPDWDLPRGHTVLFYPGAFDEGYDVDTAGRFEGMMNLQGPILFSAPAVEYGWRHEDGLNVVLHELAHLLDFQGSGVDGLPALLAPSSADAWRRLVQEEIQKVKTGHSILRPYAATNSAELFAVAVELFFEQPDRLRDGHPKLFDALVALFNLDPRSEG
ncbi:MAG: zinc-dependent peptidase [Bacteroidetes bacterium]|nr:zinc-dependent peptidase [Bacteroidota bacterium]